MLDWVPAQLRVIRITRPEIRLPHLRNGACRRRRRSGRSPVDWRRRRCSRRCWSANIAITRRSIGSRKSSPVMASISDVRRWPDGLAAPAGGSKRCMNGLRKNVFASDHLFADDTPVPVLDPGRGRTKTGRLWVYARDQRPWGGPAPPAAVYVFAPDRKSRAAGRASRTVQGRPARRRLRRASSGCRRTATSCSPPVGRIRGASSTRSLEATGSPVAAEALRRIGELYAIEARIRGQSAALIGLPSGDRFSKPIVDKLCRPGWRRSFRRVPGRSTLAEAIRYALSRWEGLTRFLHDGRIELDTNPVERAIRPVALGRKNHLFAGSDGGGARWAIALLADRNLQTERRRTLRLPARRASAHGRRTSRSTVSTNCCRGPGNPQNHVKT